MEQKDIDIYEILKNEEYGTELYTPKCGRVWHSGMANDKDSAKAIWTEDEAGREHFFDKNGKIYKEGEILLFPSKQMRDWSKFFKNYFSNQITVVRLFVHSRRKYFFYFR